MVKASLIICLFGLMICLQSMEIENVVKDVEIDLGDSLSFIPEYSSSLAYSSASYSDKPLPIRVSAKIKFKANTTWYGQDDWDFWLQTKEMTAYDFDRNKCILYQTPNGHKKSGQQVQMKITCYVLPKELEYGDHIYMSAFQNHADKYWLGFGVPIPGFSTPEFLQGLPKRTEKPQHKKK